MNAPGQIDAALARLRAGEVVAFPTETVYGLGADALRARAVERVFALKGRPSNNPLIVHVADIAGARRVVADWPTDAQMLAQRFWPGPLTLVLKRAPSVPTIVTGGGDTVAVRCPDHPMALDLLRAFGGPLVAPSANPSGRVSPTTAAHVSAAFNERDVLVLDGGPCRVGIESTVLSLVGEPTILRQGAVSASQIADVIGRRPRSGADASSAGALPSPGMLPSHYAPAAQTILFDAHSMPREWRDSPRHVTLLALTSGESTSPQTRGPRQRIQMPSVPDAYAARLYAALREADRGDESVILVERPSAAGELWDAIRDRLARAAAPRA